MIVQKASSLPPPEVRILGEREAALRLNLGCRTLQEMRLRGNGPPFIRLGARRVGYDVRDLDAIQAACSPFCALAAAGR